MQTKRWDQYRDGIACTVIIVMIIIMIMRCKCWTYKILQECMSISPMCFNLSNWWGVWWNPNHGHAFPLLSMLCVLDGWYHPVPILDIPSSAYPSSWHCLTMCNCTRGYCLLWHCQCQKWPCEHVLCCAHGKDIVEIEIPGGGSGTNETLMHHLVLCKGEGDRVSELIMDSSQSVFKCATAADVCQWSLEEITLRWLHASERTCYWINDCRLWVALYDFRRNKTYIQPFQI